MHEGQPQRISKRNRDFRCLSSRSDYHNIRTVREILEHGGKQLACGSVIAESKHDRYS
ncbi:MAG: hypothetical protein AB1762_05095 [Gemmatimonadota bacterium]